MTIPLTKNIIHKPSGEAIGFFENLFRRGKIIIDSHTSANVNYLLYQVPDKHEFYLISATIASDNTHATNNQTCSLFIATSASNLMYTPLHLALIPQSDGANTINPYIPIKLDEKQQLRHVASANTNTTTFIYGVEVPKEII